MRCQPGKCWNREIFRTSSDIFATFFRLGNSAFHTAKSLLSFLLFTLPLIVSPLAYVCACIVLSHSFSPWSCRHFCCFVLYLSLAAQSEFPYTQHICCPQHHCHDIWVCASLNPGCCMSYRSMTMYRKLTALNQPRLPRRTHLTHGVI